MPKITKITKELVEKAYNYLLNNPSNDEQLGFSTMQQVGSDNDYMEISKIIAESNRDPNIKFDRKLTHTEQKILLCVRLNDQGKKYTEIQIDAVLRNCGIDQDDLSLNPYLKSFGIAPADNKQKIAQPQQLAVDDKTLNQALSIVKKIMNSQLGDNTIKSLLKSYSKSGQHNQDAFDKICNQCAVYKEEDQTKLSEDLQKLLDLLCN